MKYSALLLMLIASFSFSQQNEMFTIESTDCKLTGPEGLFSIKCVEGSPFIATCSITGTKLRMTAIDTKTKKPLGGEEYDFVKVDKIIYAKSIDGGIKCVFNFKTKTFSYSQVNILYGIADVSISKTCVGKIIF